MSGRNGNTTFTFQGFSCTRDRAATAFRARGRKRVELSIRIHPRIHCKKQFICLGMISSWSRVGNYLSWRGGTLVLSRHLSASASWSQVVKKLYRWWWSENSCRAYLWSSVVVRLNTYEPPSTVASITVEAYCTLVEGTINKKSQIYVFPQF